MRIAQALFCDARVAGSTLMQQHILCFTLKQIWLRTNNSEEKKAWEDLFWRRGPGEATWQRGQGTKVISLHGHPDKSLYLIPFFHTTAGLLKTCRHQHCNNCWSDGYSILLRWFRGESQLTELCNEGTGGTHTVNFKWAHTQIFLK
jgi:hypothetical protein